MAPTVERIRAEGVGKLYSTGSQQLRLLRRRQWGANEAPQKVKSKSEVWALRNLDFSVDAGESIGVIGANGAGKSTLLKLLSRVTLPTEGRAITRGRLVSLLELGVGFHGDYTGRDNIRLSAMLNGVPTAEVEERFDDIVEFAGLERFIDTPVKRYSSGMYLRLAFSTVIHMSPDILLADEVLAVGDATFQEQCLQRVEAGSREGLTVLFVSHDMEAVRRICPRTIWLNGGEIVADGPTHDVIERYEKEATEFLRQSNREGGESADGFGRIVSVRALGPEGGETRSLRRSDPLTIEVQADIDRTDLPFFCTVKAFTHGRPVFTVPTPAAQRVDTPGLHTITAEIPGHLLAEETYSFSIAIQFLQDDRGKRRMISLPWATSVNVYDPDLVTPDQGGYPDRLVGVMRPELTWNLSSGRPE